jgi:hypothetical protein
MTKYNAEAREGTPQTTDGATLCARPPTSPTRSPLPPPRSTYIEGGGHHLAVGNVHGLWFGVTSISKTLIIFLTNS